jgi:hypothetical protein
MDHAPLIGEKVTFLRTEITDTHSSPGMMGIRWYWYDDVADAHEMPIIDATGEMRPVGETILGKWRPNGLHSEIVLN